MIWSASMKKFLSFIDSSCSPSSHRIRKIFMNNPGTRDSHTINKKNSAISRKGSIITYTGLLKLKKRRRKINDATHGSKPREYAVNGTINKRKDLKTETKEKSYLSIPPLKPSLTIKKRKQIAYNNFSCTILITANIWKY